MQGFHRRAFATGRVSRHFTGRSSACDVQYLHPISTEAPVTSQYLIYLTRCNLEHGRGRATFAGHSSAVLTLCISIDVESNRDGYPTHLSCSWFPNWAPSVHVSPGEQAAALNDSLPREHVFVDG